MRSAATARPLASCLMALGLTAAMLSPGQAQVTFATLDASNFQEGGNGFRFGELADNFFGTFDVTNDLISLDVNNDLDLANGFFGGAGADTFADFDAAPTQLEVTLRVDPLNVADNFRVVLADSDSATTGDEFQFFVDLSGVTPGEFVTLTQNLISPGPVFVQPQFGQMAGDEVQNYGLTQIQVQTEFGAANRLKVDIESVKLVDPLGEPDPLLIELTPATFASQVQSFDFGTFQDPGVVDQTSGNFVIDTTQATVDGDPGGLGFNGLNFDFNAFEYAIEVEAKLLANNAAETFNLLMGDADGDDSGPGLGSEDFIFTVQTDQFNASEFTTVTIPLGSGSESALVTSFGSTNEGDGLQNFDLSQLQIQVDSDAEGGIGAGLAIEIVRFSIVNLEAIDGDFNGDGVVDAADYTVYRDNLDADEDVLRGAGDGSGTVDGGDLTLWADNYGNSADGPGTAIPEPATSLMLLAAFAFAARPRQA